jgi:hypothetical protein
VHIDLSGWSPKYFPPQLVRQVSTLLKHRVLFGSDYPLLNPDRWMAAFDKLEIKDEVRPLIMKANAVKLLRLQLRLEDSIVDFTLNHRNAADREIHECINLFQAAWRRAHQSLPPRG